MHHPLTSEVLSRFHRTLVEEIQAHRPEYLTRPFTVAEIYQDLVPYRTHRDRIGVEMNGDYEDALLRLLAGEGDYLVMESDHARRELQGELESSNPNTGLFREFAAADVRLNQARLPSSVVSGSTDDPGSVDHLFGDSVLLTLDEDEDEEELTVPDIEDLAPPATPARAYASAAPPPDVEARIEAEPETPPPLRGRSAADAEGERTRATASIGGVRADAPPHSEAAADACRWCQEQLPRRDTLNYCPFCGANVHLVPCPNCGEELEPSWRFCVACGTEVGATG